ncbi:hypothetical protein HDU76_009654, partial [Blyttiomyces sp. JEL0837]
MDTAVKVETADRAESSGSDSDDDSEESFEASMKIEEAETFKLAPTNGQSASVQAPLYAFGLTSSLAYGKTLRKLRGSFSPENIGTVGSDHAAALPSPAPTPEAPRVGKDSEDVTMNGQSGVTILPGGNDQSQYTNASSASASASLSIPNSLDPTIHGKGMSPNRTAASPQSNGHGGGIASESEEELRGSLLDEVLPAWKSHGQELDLAIHILIDGINFGKTHWWSDARFTEDWVSIREGFHPVEELSALLQVGTVMSEVFRRNVNGTAKDAGSSLTRGLLSVQQFCDLQVCPANRDLMEIVRHWGLEFRSSWDSCNLGTCRPVQGLRGVEDDGLCPVALQDAQSDDKVDKLRIRSYKAALDQLAMSMARVLAAESSQHTFPQTVVLFLPNPFPHRSTSDFDLSRLIARFLVRVSRASTTSIESVYLRIVPVILGMDFVVNPFSGDPGSSFAMRELTFGVYTRCRELLQRRDRKDVSSQGKDDACVFGLPSSLYTLKRPVQGRRSAVGLSLKRPIGMSKICVSEPDRVMHTVYNISQSGKWLGISWCDSAGELMDTGAVR